MGYLPRIFGFSVGIPLVNGRFYWLCAFVFLSPDHRNKKTLNDLDMTTEWG